MGNNWCAAIVNELLASIHKHHHQPKKVSGCVMVLLVIILCDQFDICCHFSVINVIICSVLIGSSVCIQYWLCEHTNLVESQFPNATPAFVKWSIPSLTQKFNTASFKNLIRTQVCS